MGSRTGHNDIDPATRTLVPEASERGSPHCDSATAVGGGGLRSSEGDGGGRGMEQHYRGLQPGNEDYRVTREKLRCSNRTWKGSNRTHLDDDDQSEHMERRSHSQDPMKDRPATPALPRLPFSNRHLVPSQIDRQQTASTNGCPLEASRTGPDDIDPATRTPVPKASKRGSPTTTPRRR
ncbi:hypothetical protein EDB84DRAFT_1439957 [Lactarius hengduanensis]|nr:hypothetical protein EDB84DRAFT_1439957 [Lactarius hengduanensis]